MCFLLGLLLIAPVSDLNPGVWEEEVSYIISQREKQELQRLTQAADIEKFVDDFWRRRDPDPSTERNEFKEEHYRRLDYANKHFRYGGRPGWKTERGRIYIIHGEPDERRSFAPVSLRRAKLGSGAVGLATQVHEVTVDVPEAELWSYAYLPGTKYTRGPVDVYFMRVSAADVLDLYRSNVRDNPAIIQREGFYASGLYFGSRNAAEDFRVVYAGRPMFNSTRDFFMVFETDPGSFDLFETAEVSADLMRSPGDVLEDQEARRAQLRADVESAVFFGQIPASATHWFLFSDTGYTYMPLAVHLPGGSLIDLEEVWLLIEISREGRRVAHLLDRLEPGSLDPFTLRYEGVTYPTRLAVRPGPHQLDIYIVDRKNGRYRHLQKQIEVPGFEDRFQISQPILCRSASPLKQTRESLVGHERTWLTFSQFNPLVVDEFLLLPAADPVFRRKDQLTVFLEIYQPTLDSNRQPKVDLDLQIATPRGPLAGLDAETLEYLTEGDLTKISYAVTFPLARLGAGKYTVQVQADDRIGGQSHRREAEFRIR